MGGYAAFSSDLSNRKVSAPWNLHSTFGMVNITRGEKEKFLDPEYTTGNKRSSGTNFCKPISSSVLLK